MRGNTVHQESYRMPPGMRMTVVISDTFEFTIVAADSHSGTYSCCESQPNVKEAPTWLLRSNRADANLPSWCAKSTTYSPAKKAFDRSTRLAVPSMGNGIGSFHGKRHRVNQRTPASLSTLVCHTRRSLHELEVGEVGLAARVRLQLVPREHRRAYLAAPTVLWQRSPPRTSAAKAVPSAARQARRRACHSHLAQHLGGKRATAKKHP